MTPEKSDNNGGEKYVTRQEWEMLLSQLDTISRKLDALIACVGERVTRAEYDHHRELCEGNLRHLYARIDDYATSRVGWATVALVSLLSSMLVGVVVGVILSIVT